jgi:hypothetical protein
VRPLPCCNFAPPDGIHPGTSEFSRLHREHHTAHVKDDRPATAPLEVDLHHIYVALDQLIAHAHNPNVLPDLTLGARVLLARLSQPTRKINDTNGERNTP